MNILIYNWRDIKNPAAGGAEVFTHENAKRWVEKGNEVTLINNGERVVALIHQLAREFWFYKTGVQVR